MVSSLVGMTVGRAIPDATLAGLAMGRYALHGGVVRWAAGTPYAGQIVAHLLPAAGAAAPLITGAGIVAGVAAATGVLGAVVGAGFSVANFFQSKKILKAVGYASQIAELNLTATRAGFAALDQRLANLEVTLQEVRSSLTSIQQLLESTQRAELLVALEHLEKLPAIRDERVRIELLTHSATVLGKLRRVYHEQMFKADSVSGALGAEEYYIIAGLGQVRCYAELRELAMARSILADVVGDWRTWARSFAKSRLLGRNPERFLYGDLASHAPLLLLGVWLDFANDTRDGLKGVEELRSKVEPWYYLRSHLDELRDVRRTDSMATLDGKVVRDRLRIIPALNKLLARDAVFASYEAQYELLEQQGMTPGELDEALLLMLPELSDSSEHILVLTQNEPQTQPAGRTS